MTPATTPRPDEVWALRLQAGDEAVIGDIEKAVGQHVARAVAKNFPWIEKEDLLQEMLHRLWQRRLLYDPSKGSLKSYLYVIGKHLAMNAAASPSHRSKVAEDQLRAFLNGEAHTDDMDKDSRLSLIDAVLALIRHVEGNRQQTESDGELSRLEIDLFDILQQLRERDRLIIYAWLTSEDGDRWAKELADRPGLPSARAISVARIRIQKKIEIELRNRGHRFNNCRAEETDPVPLASS